MLFLNAVLTKLGAEQLAIQMELERLINLSQSSIADKKTEDLINEIDDVLTKAAINNLKGKNWKEVMKAIADKQQVGVTNNQ